MRPVKQDRPTIGVLIHDIDANVGLERYSGIVEKVRELDINLICIVQGLRTEGLRTEPEHRNILYDLVSHHIDGLINEINPSNGLMEYEEFLDFLDHFNVPKINLVEIAERYWTAAIDNGAGIHDAVKHLITVHGLRRIFFVRGPENYTVAKTRYQAFLDATREFQCYDPRLVTRGVEWNPRESELTVPDLLGSLQPGRDFDAVISSNDLWAQEFIDYFHEKGLRVPEDIAVIGYNDSVQARSFKPPLASVRAPFFEQGKLAVELLMKLIRGEEVPHDTKLPTVLIPRRSCGCMGREIVQILKEDHEMDDWGNQRIDGWNQDQFVTVLLQKIQPVGKQNHFAQSVREVVKRFFDELQGEETGIFLSGLNEILTVYQKDKKSSAIWQKAITLFRNQVLPVLEPQVVIKAEKLLHQARELISVVCLRELEHQMSLKNEHLRFLNYLQTELSRVFERTAMVDILTRSLPKLGFYTCYFVLYEDPQPYIYPHQLPTWSHLIMGYNRHGPVEVGEEGLRFPATQFLPEALLESDERNQFVLTPLFFGENQFGYIIFEMDEQAQRYYKVLCNQLKSSLWGTYLFEKEKQVERSLASSNAELKQFAYVASHDLQEPLRKIMAFGERLKKGNWDLLTDQGRDYLERIVSSASRMQILINDLLAFSRITTKAKPFCRVDLGQVVNDVLLDLEVKIAQTQAKVDVENLPALEADSIQMQQLFQNIIGNALKFHRKEVAPKIRIYTENSEDGFFQVMVEDNGIGIEKEHYERIFGVFERLHGRSEYEGSGVGLAICKKIVDRHNGKIQIESVVGAGTRFIICLPVKQENRG